MRIGQKRAKYGHVAIKRLGDSFGNYLGQWGNLWRSFVPKMTRISQEMGYIWPIPSGEVA